MTISQSQLDELWDFGDAAGSEARLRASANASSGSDRGELLTQVARALGLQERFAEAGAVLDSLASATPVVTVRVLLERGRLLNSSGNAVASIAPFEGALLIAAAEGFDFLAIDAAHMLAIADRARAAHWSARALETVDETKDCRAKRWAVSLHNNLGHARADAGDLAGALVEFELAADAARDFGTPQQQLWAQEAMDEVRGHLDN